MQYQRNMMEYPKGFIITPFQSYHTSFHWPLIIPSQLSKSSIWLPVLIYFFTWFSSDIVSTSWSMGNLVFKKKLSIVDSVNFLWKIYGGSSRQGTNDQIITWVGGKRSQIHFPVIWSKSEHFPQLWRDINLKKMPWLVHTIMEIFFREFNNYLEFSNVVSCSIFMLTLTLIYYLKR